MKTTPNFLVKPSSKVRLSKLDAAQRGGFKDKSSAESVLAKHCGQLDALQEVFYASGHKALLIVLQGMDTAGKDGAIRHIFSGINPQGCNVTSFKVPTPEEARHDFLWRVHKNVPERGMIGIFNRSHYEDVLAPVVHDVVDRKSMRKRLDDINEFESMLVDNDVIVLKFFLHISAEEQKRRLQARLDSPEKHWKLQESDFHERKFWNRYMDVYEEILGHTSTAAAPWFVIPSDHKWFRNLAISQVVVDTMKELKLKYPPPTIDAKKLKL